MADTQGIIAPLSTSNTPSIASVALAIPANKARGGWFIENLGTNPLFVLLGTGATSTIFHVVLKGASVANDGTGGLFAQTAGVIYTGDVTIAGTSPSYVVWEGTA